MADHPIFSRHGRQSGGGAQTIFDKIAVGDSFYFDSGTGGKHTKTGNRSWTDENGQKGTVGSIKAKVIRP